LVIVARQHQGLAVESRDLPDDPVARLEQRQDCNGEMRLSLYKLLDTIVEALTSRSGDEQTQLLQQPAHLVFEIALHLDE
jgi:hypothetical protein